MTWSPKNKANDDRKDDLKSEQDGVTKGNDLHFFFLVGKKWFSKFKNYLIECIYYFSMTNSILRK